MTKTNNKETQTMTIINATIAAHASGFFVSSNGGTPVFVLTASRAAEIVEALYVDRDFLFYELRSLLDEGCELLDIENDPADGAIVVNGLKAGIAIKTIVFGGVALDGPFLNLFA